MPKFWALISAFMLSALILPGNNFVHAQEQQAPSEFDAELAERLGADDYGMRSYIFVILKTGPAKIEDAAERQALFAGHFANMKRLASLGQLVLAGPLDGEGGMRGIFILDATEVEQARTMVETDPAISAGIFEPEFHAFYASAGLMEVNGLHKKLQRKQIGE